MKNKVCHITSVHPRTDVRIFTKEISSLKKHQFNVFFLVADGKGNDTINQIYDVGKPKNRLVRILFFKRKIYKKATELHCDIYHFHDPELISIGLKLKKMGKKVIYDVHEDIPRQILTKPYLPLIFRKLFSAVIEKHENKRAKKMDIILTSTSHIKERFTPIHHHVEAIKNYPLLEEFNIKFISKKKQQDIKLLYIGALTEVRGIRELLYAVSDLPVTLNIAGSFQDRKYEEEMVNTPLWGKVNYHGFVNREKIQELLFQCHIGMVILHPTENYLQSLPVKMFEYMAAGLPVIASNFPLWKDIIEKHNCGICVDPLNNDEVRKAIKYLYHHPDIIKQMGENGKKAVFNKYNWLNEEKKLINIYNNLKQVAEC